VARRILISGADGFIGTPLTAALRARGDQVRKLTRGRSGPEAIHWDPECDELDPGELEGFDAVVHLAGETVQGLWTKDKKSKILSSRRDGTRLLAGALAGCERKPECLISASAVGIYGSRGDEILNESSEGGEGFMAGVVREWEAAAERARTAGIRVVNLRLALILAERGGAMGPLKLSFKLGVGGRLGDGNHWWSWVTLDDVVRAFIHAIDNTMDEGAYNVAAPAPVRNRDFAKALGRVMHRPAVIPVPAAMLRLTARGLADELLLASQRLDSSKLEATGFTFDDSELEPALTRLLG
jgi:uncharacterized protein (TIGR01777 family)